MSACKCYIAYEEPPTGENLDECPVVGTIVYCPTHQAAERMEKALQGAEEHLEYIGYGDAYEREPAVKGNNCLQKQIERALAHTESDGHG